MVNKNNHSARGKSCCVQKNFKVKVNAREAKEVTGVEDTYAVNWRVYSLITKM